MGRKVEEDGTYCLEVLAPWRLAVKRWRRLPLSAAAARRHYFDRPFAIAAKVAGEASADGMSEVRHPRRIVGGFVFVAVGRQAFAHASMVLDGGAALSV